MTNPAEQDKLASEAQMPAAPVTKNAGRGNAMKGLFWYGLARLLLFLVPVSYTHL